MNTNLAKQIVDFINSTTIMGFEPPVGVIAFKEQLSRSIADAKSSQNRRQYYHKYQLPFVVYESYEADGSDVRDLDVWAAIKNLLDKNENLLEIVGKPIHTEEETQ